MSEMVIQIEDVKKKFKMYFDKPKTMKERVIRGGKGAYKEFYALNNISFNIKKGHTVGFIGKNGSGKSTLLKIINRTMYPDSGKVTIKGKVSSLIELGAGFHPDLSGRENIYTNATIFGLTKQEIDARLPEIIAFSELEEFIDNPVRTYSSGMYARLAFSVAIHVDADILLVDEILGVGDTNFQAKCAQRIYELQKSGVTIVLVTHDMSTIHRLCDYAIWIDHGKVMAEGEPHKVELKYLEFMANEQEQRTKIEEKRKEDIEIIDSGATVIKSEEVPSSFTSGATRWGNQDIQFTDVKMFNQRGADKRSFHTGETVSIEVYYRCNKDPKQFRPNIGFEINRTDGNYIYGTNLLIEKLKLARLQQKGVIRIEFDEFMLLPGEYVLGAAIVHPDGTKPYDYHKDITHFRMFSEVCDLGVFRPKHRFFVDNVLCEKEDKNETKV